VIAVGVVGCAAEPTAHDVVDALWQDLDARHALFDLRLPDGPGTSSERAASVSK
jgi:hypothetical protein